MSKGIKQAQRQRFPHTTQQRFTPEDRSRTFRDLAEGMDGVVEQCDIMSKMLRRFSELLDAGIPVEPEAMKRCAVQVDGYALEYERNREKAEGMRDFLRSAALLTKSG